MKIFHRFPLYFRLLALIALLATTSLSSARAANPDLLFQPLPSFSPAPTAVLQTALVDLNHDGKADLVRLVNASQVSVQLGVGDGTFGTPSFFEVGNSPFVLVVGDVDNDGNPDLIVGNSDGSQTVSVLIGNGNGTFQTQITSNIGMTATALAVTDFNKDGKLDLIATGYLSAPQEGYVSTLLGNGGGTFGNRQTFPASARSLLTLTRDVAVADLNNDGFPDFIVTAPLNGLAIISFLNNGNGTFTRAYEMQLNNVGRLVLADFNGDGKADIAVTVVSDATVGQTAAGINLAVARGNGDGSFEFLFLGPPLYSLTENAALYGAGTDTRSKPESSIVALDMDGDGVRDLVLTSKSDSGPNYVAILRGSPSGIFTLASRREVASNSVWTAVADLNGDGAPDFVTTPNSSTTQVFLAAGPSVTAPAFTSANSTSFILGASNSFNVTTLGNPAPTFSISGTLPAGVTFTAAGVLSGTPGTGTEGTYPLTITATNAFAQTATQSFTLNVIRADLLVTTAVDEDNGSPNPNIGSGASLREILNFANTLTGPQTISFAPALAGQNINLTATGDISLGASALRVNGNITIQGLTGSTGITIRNATGGNLRVFFVDFGGSLTLNDLTVADGLASSNAGGGIYNAGTVVLNRCTLRNNRANLGGALNSGGGGSGQTATLTNCTIANNQAAFAGGGIQNDASSTLSFTNVTVTANSLTNSNVGAGLNNFGAAMLINTIVVRNLSSVNDPADIGGSVNTSSHHNMIGLPAGGLTDGVNGNAVNRGRILMGTLAANGGPTQTVSLLNNSRSINAGATVSGVTTDQRGVLRPQYGAPDIGAYEFDSTLNESLVVTTANDEGDFTSDPTFGNGTSLREALAYAATLPGPSGITFAPDIDSTSVTLDRGWNGTSDSSALRVTGQVTIQGPTDRQITIAYVATGQKRHLLVEASGNLTVSNLTFTNGYGDNGGSIENLGRLTVRSCTFTGNQATQDGGAVHSATTAQSVLIENSTFSGNSTALNSSALASGTAQTAYRHLTITNNSGGSGAMLLFQNTATMINSLVAGNTPDGIVAQGGAAFSGQSTNNLLGTGGSGGLAHGVNGNLVGVAANQLFLGSLGGNGGPTPTVPLLANSPALNAGVAVSGLTTDQRGIVRPQGSTPDIGAYEFVVVAPVFTSSSRAIFQPNRAGSFTVTATSAPPASFAITGTLPSGVTFTSAGLLSGTPVTGTEGDYPLTITANALGVVTTQAFTLTVSSYDLIVTTVLDEDDGSTNPALGTGTSLREAIHSAIQQSQPQTIGFDPSLAGQTINLTIDEGGGSAFNILNGNANVTVQGLVGSDGITIRRGTTADLRLFYSSGSLTLNDLTFSNGKASSAFGGAINNQGTLRMNRCTLVGNSAIRGGAISSGDFTALQRAVFLTNCTFVNNTASIGGGAIQVFPDSAATLTNVTIADNSAGVLGGGIFASAGPAVRIINSIVARNTTTAGGASDVYSNSNIDAASHHNLIGTGGSGGLVNGGNGNIVGVLNPGIGSLAANGGPTQTVALLSGPAINGGAVVSGVTTDQRGVTRPQYGTPDIGAYEFVGTLAPSIVVTTAVDEADFSSDPRFGTGTSLREALAYAQTLGGAPTITFAPELAGQTVTLTAGATGPGDDTALRTAGEVTIDGLGSVTITHSSPVKRRLIANGTGTKLTLVGLTLTGGDLSGLNLGGAVWSSGELTVRNCTLSNNKAFFGGAIESFGTLTVVGSTFVGNSADSDGGAIHSNFDAVAQTLTNCTFVTNTAPGASAVTVARPVVAQWSHLTAVDNTGGAVFNVVETAVTMRNSIAARNVGEGAITNLGNGTGAFTAASTNNIVAGTAWTGLNPASANFLNASPAALYLGTLASNGGPTQTVALLPGSPAMNAGVPIAGVATDQRGLARGVGTAPDLGAVEDAIGDDDPDRDSLTNFVELQLGTNPLALDTDGDGFNDATESMNGSDPKLATSFPAATRIERVLGVGAARGLDLAGNFLYAVNVGTNGAVGQIGDANFTADNVAGVTVTAGFEVPAWGAREFGSSAEEDRLEQVFRSIRFDGPTAGVKVDAANLVPGRTYQLQLLIADAPSYDRAFDVSVNGTKIIPLYNTNLAQGANFKPYAASAIVHTFTAPTSTLNVTLATTTFGTFDPNPILNGFTLEEIPTAATAPLISPASGTYTGSVAVSIATAAQGAAIRYTLDGSDPSETSGTIYSGPFALTTSAAVRAIAVGGGWQPSAISSANYVVQTPLQAWRALHGLAADGAQDLANPSGDGVANILKYAFNLAPHAGDLLASNTAILQANGTAGLPFITRDAQGRLFIEFLRRKAAAQTGITYAVETGGDLSNLQALDLTSAMVVSLDANWERISVTDPTITPDRFGRVRVEVCP
ncbi:MAG: choice-of-anchor Q domain-containing protein [Chthoniobacteraceae bacterium]